MASLMISLLSRVIDLKATSTLLELLGSSENVFSWRRVQIDAFPAP